MKTWRAEREPSPELITAIAEILLAGGVVLLPTDTIYGLHALAFDAAATERIVRLKGRPGDKPFVIIAASSNQLRTIGTDVPPLLDQIWPAPMTAVLRRGSATIAARVPDLRWLRDLLERTGPLISTSANRRDEPPISSPEELESELQNGLDAALDVGRIEGKASTLVDFTGDEPVLIREGDRLFTQNLRKTLRISL